VGRKFCSQQPNSSKTSKYMKISQHLGNEIDRMYTFEENTSIIKKHKETSIHGPMEQLLIKSKAYFLPNGYPSSTNEGYGRYVSLQALAYIFASTSSVLSMQCLLYAMGLGENSLPLAATLNWVCIHLYLFLEFSFTLIVMSPIRLLKMDLVSLVVSFLLVLSIISMILTRSAGE
jgi:hypothetical protein